MLPVVICEPDSDVRARWMDIVEDLTHKEYPSLRVELLPGTEHELDRMLETQSGIMLVLLAITERSAGGVEACIQLFLKVMARNRDNYVILLLNDAKDLDTVLNRCMRPAGILQLPLREELMRANLKRVLNDYASFHPGEVDAEYIVITTGKAVERIAYRDILYMEAQNKLLNICLRHRVISVRGSLNELEKTLPECFVRCHRSYIVNRSFVARFNSPVMELELTTQERLPVSRSFKGVLRESLKGGGCT